MSNLGPQHINVSFVGLLQVPNGVLPTPQQVQDGSGNNTGLWIGTGGPATSAQVQVSTATAGQTVFTLSGFTYVPGENMIDVYVDGVNQVSGTAYTETNSTTITFSEGLHVGAVVKFIV